MTLLNWSGKPIPNMVLGVQVPFKIRHLSLASGAEVHFEMREKTAFVTTSLRSADVLMIRP